MKALGRIAATALCCVLATTATGQEDRKMASAKAAPRRCVLDGMPRVGFYNGQGAPEDDLLPSCVKSFLQHRGEDLGFLSRPGARDPWHDVHCYLLGMSGGAFRIACDPRKWSPADGSPFAVSRDALEPVRRALAAAGYGCEVLLKKSYAAELGLPPTGAATEAAWTRRVVDSISGRKMPVIAVGVIGPPEPCLVAGYDDAGAVLIGWNAFQGDPAEAKGVTTEKSGYFRKRGWFKDTQALIVIGERRPRPEPRKAYRSALAFGLHTLRMPMVRQRFIGQAAFSRWADQLLDDSQFSAKAKKALANQFFVHHERGGVLAEARAYGTDFLRFAADACPEARDDLLAAAKCFQDEHDLVWSIWEFTGGVITNDAGARKFAEPGVRRRIVPLIRLCRTRDAEAARHIESAIEKIDRTDRDAAGDTVALNPVAKVRRDGARVWIEGLPALARGAGRDCAFLGSLEAATSVTAHPTRYVDMMGATGVAFRTRWSNPDTVGGWDMTSPGAEFIEEWEDVQRATGWMLDAWFPGVEGDPTKDPRVARVMHNIDAGKPVMAAVDGPDVGLIVGYADRGNRMLIHRYGDAEVREVEAKAACGGFQLTLTAPTPAPSPLSAFAAGIRSAVRNWRRPKSSAGYASLGHEWYYGENALRTWADDLLKRDPGSTSKDGQTLYHLNRWVYASLLDARKAAVEYLRANAPLLSGDASAAVERAALLYADEVALLAAPFAAKAPWLEPDRNPVTGWTEEQRKAQHAILLQAVALEDKAVRELAAAAVSVESTPPPLWPHLHGQFALLEGVPRVAYNVRLCPFPGSLESALKYLGDAVDYDYLMGVTGACFRRFWEKDDGGNVDLLYLGEEVVRRVAAGVRREMTVIPHADRNRMVTALKESVSAGRPVISFGIVGPPEAGVTMGYDRGGEVLYGWSDHQDRSWPGCYQQPDWHARAHWPGDIGFVIVGDKDGWGGRTDREILLSALRWAIDLSKTAQRPEAPKHLSGLAAYDGWADALEVDADYPKGDEAVMGARVMVHGDQCVMLGERGSAAKFLRSMAKHAPEAGKRLLAAADLYDRVAAAKVWPWGHDMGAAARDALADRAARRGIASEVRAARKAEAEAVELLVDAVRAMTSAGR